MGTGKRRGALPAAGLRGAAVAVAGAALLLLGARPARGLRWRSFTTQEGAREGGLDPREGLESPPSLGGEETPLGWRGATDASTPTPLNHPPPPPPRPAPPVPLAAECVEEWVPEEQWNLIAKSIRRSHLAKHPDATEDDLLDAVDNFETPIAFDAGYLLDVVKGQNRKVRPAPAPRPGARRR